MRLTLEAEDRGEVSPFDVVAPVEGGAVDWDAVHTAQAKAVEEAEAAAPGDGSPQAAGGAAAAE